MPAPAQVTVDLVLLNAHGQQIACVEGNVYISNYYGLQPSSSADQPSPYAFLAYSPTDHDLAEQVIQCSVSENVDGEQADYL